LFSSSLNNNNIADNLDFDKPISRKIYKIFFFFNKNPLKLGAKKLQKNLKIYKKNRKDH